MMPERQHVGPSTHWIPSDSLLNWMEKAARRKGFHCNSATYHFLAPSPAKDAFQFNSLLLGAQLRPSAIGQQLSNI